MSNTMKYFSGKLLFGSRSNEEPLCQFIGDFMVHFSSNSSFIENVAKILTCV